MIILKMHGTKFALFQDYFGHGKDDLMVIVAETYNKNKAIGWYKSLEAKLEEHFWSKLSQNDEDERGLENFLANKLQYEI